MNHPPASICLLRLSALGDVCHVVPVVKQLQAAWPQCGITWVVAKRELELLRLLPGVEFLVLDKSAGLAGYRSLAKSLRGRRFDVLLLMQVSMRAHLASLLISAKRRIGFDAHRGRDLHGAFVSERIDYRDREHVLDGHAGFLRRLGLQPMPWDWSIPLPAEAREWAAGHLPGHQATLLISPASSDDLRTWMPSRYAAVANYAQRVRGMRVVLCGGPSARERQLADAILAESENIIDLVGKDSLPRFLALLERGSLLLSPDSGPAHMAALTGTPVLGLYANSNPARSGPYRSLDLVINAYPQACRELLGKEESDCRWGQRIDSPEAMRLITVEQVCQMLDRWMNGLARASA